MARNSKTPVPQPLAPDPDAQVLYHGVDKHGNTFVTASAQTWRDNHVEPQVGSTPAASVQPVEQAD